MNTPRQKKSPARAWLARLGALVLFFLIPGLAAATPITLHGTVRDFNSYNTSFNGVAGHVDFQHKGYDDLGLVQTRLGTDGKPVFAGGVHDTVASAASFYQWYHDDPSVNRTGSISIVLNPITPTTYQFSSAAFFPIDGALLAQATCCTHNFGFTTEFHTLFTYKQGQHDTFTFAGDDDVFVFINKQLAIDLGGVHRELTGSVNLNDVAGAFGMTDGETYSLDVFHAERHTGGSTFTITTSLQLEPVAVPEPGSLSLLGLGLLAVGYTRRQKKPVVVRVCPSQSPLAPGG